MLVLKKVSSARVHLKGGGHTCRAFFMRSFRQVQVAAQGSFMFKTISSFRRKLGSRAKPCDVFELVENINNYFLSFQAF